MLSLKLVQLIEKNSERIAGRVIREIRESPEMTTLAGCSDGVLREWCQDIVKNLGYLLSAPKDDEIRRRFHILGQIRCEENVPLHEAVLRCQILKDKIVGFVHEEGIAMSAMELYGEEELERRMGRFFDAIVYQLVRGYEDAWRRATRVRAAS